MFNHTEAFNGQELTKGELNMQGAYGGTDYKVRRLKQMYEFTHEIEKQLRAEEGPNVMNWPDNRVYDNLHGGTTMKSMTTNNDYQWKSTEGRRAAVWGIVELEFVRAVALEVLPAIWVHPHKYLSSKTLYIP